jgi:mycothiol S-conjugate amidase
MEVHQKAWPTEDFELAESLVETELPEDDLFAGVREIAGSYDGSAQRLDRS